MKGLPITLVLLLTVGCTSVQIVTYETAVREAGDTLRSESGLHVRGYVADNGVRHRWPARAYLRGDGSVRFLRTEESPAEIVVPPGRVHGFYVSKTDWKKVATGTVVTTGIVATILYVLGQFFLAVLTLGQGV